MPNDHLTRYLARIREVCPGLRVHRATLVTGDGQYNDLVFTATNEGDLVFRFPRFAAGVARLERIIQLLRAIRGKVPLPVPEPRYCSLTPSKHGQAFIGYPHIPGESLRRETVRALDQHTLRALVAQAVSFLRALHAVPMADAFPHPVASGGNLLHEWRDLYARVRHHLFAHMRPAARDQVARHFETFLADPRIATIQPAVVHGDFGTGNLLFDPRAARLTGVVDFDHAAPGDPALDYAPLTSDFPIEMVRAISPEVDGFEWRMSFYRGTYLLQEALYGAEHDDPEAFHGGLASYT